MQPEHHDPFSEGGQRGLEKLMAIGVLTEAGSRLAAEHVRARAGNTERQQDREHVAEQAAAQARRLAAAEAGHRVRQWAAVTGDPERLRQFLRDLPVQEVARHWRHAAGFATSSDAASTVMAAAEEELRRRWPALLGAYDAARRDGAHPQEAMRHAATYAFYGGARPHGATSHAPGGALPAVGTDLEQAIRAYGGDLDPVARTRWLRGLEQRGWSPQSLAHIETLLDQAADQHRHAAGQAATPNDPDTGRDEHHAGLDTAGTSTARAEDLAADAAAHRTAAGPAAHDGAGYDAIRGVWVAPAKLVRLSFPVPAAHALRSATPTPSPGTAPAMDNTSRRGRTR